MSAKEAAWELGLTHLELLRRLKMEQIPGARKMGWNWVIPDEAINEVRQMEWYQQYMKNRPQGEG
jgi:hypothetical protein